VDAAAAAAGSANSSARARRSTTAKSKSGVVVSNADDDVADILDEASAELNPEELEAEKMLQVELDAIAEKEDNTHEDWQEENEFQQKIEKKIKTLSFKEKVDKLEDLMAKAEQ